MDGKMDGKYNIIKQRRIKNYWKEMMTDGWVIINTEQPSEKNDDNQYYIGEVVLYEPFYEYYYIKYEDGDKEEFTVKKVTEHLLKKTENNDGYKVYKPNQICLRTKFYQYWREKHSNVVVRKPSMDICGTCFKFNMLYYQDMQRRRKEAEDQVQNKIIFGDDNYDEFNNEYDADNVQCDQYDSQEATNLRLIKISEHVNKAKSMTEFFDEVEKEAKEKAPGKVDVHEVCIVIIIDFMQNLDLSSFWSNQPVSI